ncbi:protein of unknown function [Brochothrix thermosphacta]|nr:protein of unknown function [Brochothrix thermosphacta]
MLAQLVEQLTLNQRVEGSSPPQPIIAVIVANLFAYENSMGRKFSRKIEYQSLCGHCCEFIRLRDQ